MYKKLMILIFSLFAVMVNADVLVQLEPETVAVGDRFTIWVSAEGSKQPQIAAFPKVDGIRWDEQSSSTRTQIINLKMNSSIGYSGIALKAGTLKIPPMEIVVGRKTELSKPLELKVVPPGKLAVTSNDDAKISLEQAAFVKGRLLTGERSVYVGEEIPVEIELWTVRGLGVGRMSWPELNFNQISFRNYQATHPENPRFAGQPKERFATHDERSYIVRTFRTAIIPLATGKISGSAEINMEVQIPDERRRSRSNNIWDDDFFGFPSARRVAHTAHFNFSDLTVKALPDAPANALFLGLLGKWRVEYRVDQKEFHAGEPFTLELTIVGDSSADNLNAPELNLSGFRTYPPEVQRSSGSVKIRYAVIPLRSGQEHISINTAIFDLATDKYQEFKFEQTLEIKPASGNFGTNVPSQPLVDGTVSKPKTEQEDDKNKNNNSNILYLKKINANAVVIPFFMNNIAWLLALALLGPLFFVISEIRWLRLERLNSSPLWLRRRNALANRRKILRRVKKATPEQVNGLIQSTVVPHLNDLLGQPPGTTATELAQKLQNRDLAECLESSDEAGFMPGTTVNQHDLKTRLLKALKHVTLILLLFLTPTLKAEMGKAEESAFDAYDRGDFVVAAQGFRSQLNPQRPKPALLYNLGNALCKSGDLAGALVCYEKARLLAPRDHDILENLNFVRRQLIQEEAGQINRPADLVFYLRDLLRPDQWLLVAAAAWSALWLVAALRRRPGFNRKVFSLLLMLIILFSALTMVFFQYHDEYSGTTAVVKQNATQLRSLPSKESGKVERTVRSGTKVKIIEPRRDWVRVRLDHFEGWMKAEDIEAIKF